MKMSSVRRRFKHTILLLLGWFLLYYFVVNYGSRIAKQLIDSQTSEKATILGVVERIERGLIVGQHDIAQTLNTTRPVSTNFTNLSCKKLFYNDKQQTDIARNVSGRSYVKSVKYLHMLRHCESYKLKRGYLNFSFTDIEKNFPIAFSIIMYKNFEQTERLLRAIYRPQNVYCIHVDAKAHYTVKRLVKALVSCFPNVILPRKSVNVSWGTFSVLESELVCMRQLWRYKTWKYYINLTGQEFPLKTNLELVKILTALNGASLADGTNERTNKYFQRRFTQAGPPPHGIKPVKGIVHAALSREFVDFALHDSRSLDFLEWLKKTIIPDETFFPSLNHNPHLGIPGSFLGDVDEYPQKPSIIRYKNMAPTIGSTWNRPCAGKYVRSVCVLGVGDLHRLYENVALFVNKIDINYQPLTFECLEQLLYNRTRLQYLNEELIDVTFYERLDNVKLRNVIKAESD